MEILRRFQKLAKKDQNLNFTKNTFLRIRPQGHQMPQQYTFESKLKVPLPTTEYMTLSLKTLF